MKTRETRCLHTSIAPLQEPAWAQALALVGTKPNLSTPKGQRLTHLSYIRETGIPQHRSKYQPSVVTAILGVGDFL